MLRKTDSKTLKNIRFLNPDRDKSAKIIKKTKD